MDLFHDFAARRGRARAPARQPHRCNHKRSGGFVTAPAQKVPVLCRADVAVAGAGTAGVFAALGAAALGAKTVLVDENGQLGGNIGPALITMGWLAHWNKDGIATWDFRGGLKGIALDFFRRVQKFNNVKFGSIKEAQGKYHNTFTAHTASYVAGQMLEEYGVKVLVHAYAADPIMRGRSARGLLIETKSGRYAIRAKTVIDATGNAEIAARAGAEIMRGFKPAPAHAPVIHPNMLTAKYPANYNETEMKFYIANINARRFKEFLGDGRKLKELAGKIPPRLLPILQKAEQSGEYSRTYFPDGENVWYCFRAPYLSNVDEHGLLEEFVFARGDFDTLNFEQMSRIELKIRSLASESVGFLRKRVPGFEKAYILCSAPYLGARGGPCINGKYLLTPEDMMRGARFRDVLFVNMYEGYLKRGSIEGFDIPYRMLLPKNVGGLLVSGRGCSYVRRGHDPRAIRGRQSMMMLGQATGYAAALAARLGICPRKLNVKMLQQALIKAGFYLGDKKRLKELGLPPVKHRSTRRFV